MLNVYSVVFYCYDNGAIELVGNIRFYTAMATLLTNIVISNLFYYWIRLKLGNEKAFLLAFTTAQNLPALIYVGVEYSLGYINTLLLYAVLAIYLSSIAIIFTQYRRIVWHGIPCLIDFILLAIWG